MAKKTTLKKDPCFICARDTLIHVRPSIGSGVIGVCKTGTKLAPINHDEDWMQVDDGFISMANINTVEDTEVKKDNG